MQWKGYGACDNSWEQEQFMNCPYLIRNFELKDAERLGNYTMSLFNFFNLACFGVLTSY